MRALAFCAAALLWLAGPVLAQGFSGLARLDAAQSTVRDAGDALEVQLFLSQAVPYRVFTLTDPARLVLDFREVDFRGATPETMLGARAATDLRFGALRPGWSRMVVDLAGPMRITQAGMQVREIDGTAQVLVALVPTDAARFADLSGAPETDGWDMLDGLDVTAPAPDLRANDRFVVVIDPGHGGIDPGALRDDLVEADLMLALAVELAEAIDRTGDMTAVLTRDADLFVPLDARISIARAAVADVFVSLHADALETDAARGASVYTLSDAGSVTASGRMAERHEQGDLLAGLDLSGHDDTVATILMDLARLETGPAAQRLADTMVTGLRDAGVELNSRPRRDGQFAVLTAADFPSVLIEAGFLSSAADRARLTSDAGRAALSAGIVQALQRWRASEAARAPLVRQ